MIVLPRQARDKHRESTQTEMRLSQVTSAADRWIGSEQTAFRERAGKDQYSGWGLGADLSLSLSLCLFAKQNKSAGMALDSVVL
jgi:hypothetical protein